MDSIKCPYCNGDAVKRGKRKTKQEIKQLYSCRSCGKRWAEDTGKSKLKSILFSIAYYNKGLNIREIINLVEKKFKIKTSKSSVHRWIKELSSLCDYYKLRNQILERFGKDIITTKVLKHQEVIYHFKYHKGKVAILKGYENLAKYLENFVYGYPKEFFESDVNRCSKVDIQAFTRKEEKESPVCRITDLVLKTVKENKKRHKAVEEFLLINDASTIAVEVPVWLWEKSVGGITGHIDILQVRDGKIYVLDFKPDGAFDRDAMSQLYLYALGLSFRTKIPLENFRCAWFNDKAYYEFEPSKAITRDYWKKAFGDREYSEKKFVARQERTDVLAAKYTDAPAHLVILSTDVIAVHSDDDLREGCQTLPNKIFHTSFVESILTLDCCLNASSSDQIGQSSAKARAKYCTSFGCGAISLASSANMLNCSKGMKSISDFKNLNTIPTSSGDSLVFSTISSRFLPSSKNKNSGDTNPNLLTNLFTKQIIKTSPFESREDITLFASTTNNKYNHFNDFINLSAKALSTLSDSSLTSSSVSLDFETIDFTSSNFANSLLTSLLTTRDHSVPETFFNSSSNSSGIGITTSAIFITNSLVDSVYLNVLQYVCSPSYLVILSTDVIAVDSDDDFLMPRFGTSIIHMPRDGTACHDLGKVCHESGTMDFVPNRLNQLKEGRFG